MTAVEATAQRKHYEAAYQESDNSWGFPDRMITDGHELNNRTILCLGSGAGSDVWFLAVNNLVVGVDYALSGLKVGARHRLRSVQSDLNLSARLPFCDGAFDVVVCKDILEHLVDPLTILREVKRVIRNEGYIVLNLPNHFFLPMRLRLLLGKGLRWRTLGADHTRDFQEWDYMHLRFFTYRGLCQMLATAGLRVEKWFWDLGTIAYYNNPDRWLEPQLWKRANGLPISPRGIMGLRVLLPLWRVFNALFPRHLRSSFVSLSPGLLCASFYCHLRSSDPRSLEVGGGSSEAEG